MPLWRESKLSQSPSDLFPDGLDHSLMVIILRDRHVMRMCSGEKHTGHGSVRYTATRRRDILPIGHGLIKRLLQVKVRSWTALIDIG
jgi:hypothetical protein